MEDVTLQINLSPGDINYAYTTVTALVMQHSNIRNRLLVVDCCRPQKTVLCDPDIRFPLAEFEKKVQLIRSISERLLKEKTVTAVRYLIPGDPLFKWLSKKYLRGVYDCTHSAGGTANMGYWAGMELPDTRYVLHYDGDMLLFQHPEYNWVAEAIAAMQDKEEVLIAIPRLCPPVAADVPSLHQGRLFTSFKDYWINDWFSTRHFLLDKKRLEKYLPLVRGRVMIALLLRKYGKRAFPIDPEILLFRSVARRGGRCLILKSKQAWLLHPADKPGLFIELLPQILASVTAGQYPVAQAGMENIDLNAWKAYLQPYKDAVS